MSHHLAALMKHKLVALVIAASTGGGAVAFVAAGSAAPPPPLSIAGNSAAVAIPSATPALPSPAAGSASALPRSTKLPAIKSTIAPSPKVTPKAPVVPAAVAVVAKSVSSPRQAAVAVTCRAKEQLNDAKINWLLGEIAKTASKHPELSSGVATVKTQLEALLGRNMCGSEAQAVIANLCLDPAVVKLLNQMVGQLPFFIRPLVHDPCKTNLVDVMNQVGFLVPGLG
jgi:hypothetical protein